MMINTAIRDCISRKSFQILISLELLNIGHQFKPCQNPLLSQPNSNVQRGRLIVIVLSSNCELLIQKPLGNPPICTFFISLPNVYYNDKQEWRLSRTSAHIHACVLCWLFFIFYLKICVLWLLFSHFTLIKIFDRLLNASTFHLAISKSLFFIGNMTRTRNRILLQK